ncbi:MAG: hypothetical protein PHE83_09395 [Opitutaceae bacterium]|nr:hypothetical protein [Opitutaceae bacterium]
MKEFFRKPLVLFATGAVVGILAAFAYGRFFGPLKKVATKLPGSQPAA